MPSAIDRQRMMRRIDQGKGRKDQHVICFLRYSIVLIDYWHAVRPEAVFQGHPWSTDHLAQSNWLVRRRTLFRPVQTSDAAFNRCLRSAFAGIRDGPSDIQLLMGHTAASTRRRMPADRCYGIVRQLIICGSAASLRSSAQTLKINHAGRIWSKDGGQDPKWAGLFRHYGERLS